MFMTEAVELCPYCMAENVYPNWNVNQQGYIAKWFPFAEWIFLCDECMHADDNLGQECDWHETEFGSECFRGKIYREV